MEPLQGRNERERETHLLSVRSKIVLSLPGSVLGSGGEPLEKKGVHLERDLVFEMS